MPAKSGSSRYGAVAISIHWLSAILIIFQFITGFWAAQLTDSGSKIDLLLLHVPIGNLVLILTVARIFWWWFFDKKPVPDSSGPHWQEVAAKAVHLLFYVIIIGMAGSGIALIFLSGANEVLIGGQAGALPNFFDFSPRIPHGVGARLMLALLVLHVGAGIYHHFVLRDNTLKRMGIGR